METPVQKPTFSFVMLSESRNTPRPVARGLIAPGFAELLPPGPWGWAVNTKVGHGLVPPESALLLMEKGACAPEEAEQMVQLAAEYRAALARGDRQADDARDEEQLIAFFGAELEQAFEGD